MARSKALTWITKEAKRLRRKFPKRFSKWTDYVSQASAIYSSKHKGKSPVGKKHKTKVKRSRGRKVSGQLKSIVNRTNYVGTTTGHKKGKPIPGITIFNPQKSVAGIGMHHSVDQKALSNLNYLVAELEKSKQNWDRLKVMKRKKELTDPFHKKLYQRYPNYIKSLKKQISEAKKNIR